MADSETGAPPDEQVVERQHYVPQFYLKRFANDSRELAILDGKYRKIIRPRGTTGICRESFFYGLKTGEADQVSQTVEKQLQRIETRLAKDLGPVISKILGNEHVAERDKRVVAWLMSMLWIRTPWMRRHLQQMEEQLIKHVMKVSALHPDGYEEWMDRYDREHGTTTSEEERSALRDLWVNGQYRLQLDNSGHLEFLDQMKGFANMFHGQDWNVYVSRGAGTFVTSDAPVAVLEPEYEGFYPPTFLERTHYFALTPDICVEARFPDHLTGKKFRRRTLFPDRAHIVAALNEQIGFRADRYVFSRDREPLEQLLRTMETITGRPQPDAGSGSSGGFSS